MLDKVKTSPFRVFVRDRQSGLLLVEERLGAHLPDLDLWIDGKPMGAVSATEQERVALSSLNRLVDGRLRDGARQWRYASMRGRRFAQVKWLRRVFERRGTSAPAGRPVSVNRLA